MFFISDVALLSLVQVVLLIFVSGKVVLTGSKEREKIYEAFNNIYPVLTEFRKQAGHYLFIIPLPQEHALTPLLLLCLTLAEVEADEDADLEAEGDDDGDEDGSLL